MYLMYSVAGAVSWAAIRTTVTLGGGVPCRVEAPVAGRGKTDSSVLSGGAEGSGYRENSFVSCMVIFLR